MMGSFVTRILIMAFGYAYPAYECYKTVEKNKPAIDQLRFWCQYWILVAVLTASERFGDAFISWLPMYSEAKLAFFVYLWHPKTRGTTYVYETFFKPYIARHEVEIDRSLYELRVRAGDAVVLYWQKAATYGQTRFFEILQHASSHTKSSRNQQSHAQKQQQPQQDRTASLPALVQANKSTSANPVQQATGETMPSSGKNQTSATQTQQQSSLVNIPSKSPSTSVPPETASSPTKSQARSVPADVAAKPAKNLSQSGPAEVVSSPSKSQPCGASTSATSTTSSFSSRISEAKSKLSDVITRPSPVEDSDEPPKDTIMEEAIRVTRGRLRKARSGTAVTSPTP